MQCLTNINRFKIPNDVMMSYLTLYKSIGNNHYNHSALNSDYQVMVRQTICNDVYYFAKLFNLSVTESRLKSLIYKDIIPKNKDEKLVLRLKQAFIKIHKETSTFELLTNEIFDMLKFLYKDIIQDSKLQFVKIERKKSSGMDLLSSGFTSKRDELDLMIKLFTENTIEQKFESSFIIGNFYIDFLNVKPFCDKNEEIALITLYILLITSGYEVYEYISFMQVLYENRDDFHKVVLSSNFNWAEGFAETLNLHRFIIMLSLESYKQINLLIRDYEFDSQLNKSNNVENTINKLDDVFSKDDIRNVHPYISDSTINRTLKRLRDDEIIRPLGKGRSAKWIKIVKVPNKKTVYEQLDLRYIGENMDNRIDKIILDALKEDIPTIDVTTDNLFTNEVSEGIFIAKEPGILSGVKVMERTFMLLDDSLTFKIINSDGYRVDKGDTIAIISGKTSSILKAERVALNLMQRMSGIATLTKKFVDEINNDFTKILDTRKTTPNLRVIEKLAVIHGGGVNHRFCLSDQVMIKDNHIKTAGSISKAVKTVKSKVDHNIKIEVEVETFEQFLEAIDTECDIIMLDNMSNDLMRKCVLNNNQKLLEASGNMTVDRIKGVSETGVDFISVGALTHSYKAMDISLKFSK